MPLAFDSLSHGKIAFGFFNIQTDLLLLNRYFFFASDFCRLLVEAAGTIHERNSEWFLKGTLMEDERIGNLMGAIHGFDFRGFIGAVYRLYPFPQELEGFRQNPEGFRTRAVLEQLLPQYGSAVDIPVRLPLENNEAAISVYRFTRENFQELMAYVWLGGYPRWRDDRRPAYVEAMKEAFPFLLEGQT
ncbi:MAG: hypothetical protein HY892_05825 [Deltaproteobacteria bacterium]|nr:hypothetical protein [Deltaproteobacteria bacterium]